MTAHTTSELSDVATCSSNTRSHIFRKTVQIIISARLLSKVPRKKREQLALDISIVALGIRVGYLFDVFPVRHFGNDAVQALTRFLNDLREEILEYRDVIVVLDPVFEQYFFVNAKMLLSENNVDATSPPWTAFVLLSQPPKLSFNMPSGVRELLSDLLLTIHGHFDSEQYEGPRYPPLVHLSSPQSETNRKVTSSADMIPLAAILLEYPIAYVPLDEQQTDFLPRTELDVFECILHLPEGVFSDEEREHVFMKFSCPRVLDAEDPSNTYWSEDVEQRLLSRFGPRAQRIGIGGRMHVRRYQEVFDRVAL
ncbi:hypothetical protein K474DRAFT_612808 [Panus rudis PR-1116 ss-1]|nr:hypothetical protein K474DRAFT_612808 [Panus rudis PR-1116 ss-1]